MASSTILDLQLIIQSHSYPGVSPIKSKQLTYSETINLLGIRTRRILPRAENKIENKYSPAALETSTYAH